MLTRLPKTALHLPARLRRGAAALWRETDGECGWYPFGCCCTVFGDSFDDASIHADWTQVSGSWSEGSGVLSTSSTTAIITRDTGLASSELSVSVSVRGATSDRLRIIFAFEDSSNYWYAEAIIGTSQTFRIVQRDGGVDTNKITTTTTLSASTWYTFTVCVNPNGAMKAQIASTALNAGLQGPTALGVVGLGTGSTASGSTQFDDLTVKKVNENCETCGGACSRCTTGVGPPAWDVYLPSSLANDECTLCTQWAAGPIRVYWCFGGSECLWSRLLEECGMSAPATPKHVKLQVRIALTSGGTPTVVQVRLLRRDPTVGDSFAGQDTCSTNSFDGLTWQKTITGTSPIDCATSHDCTTAGLNSFCISAASSIATIVPVF